MGTQIGKPREGKKLRDPFLECAWERVLETHKIQWNAAKDDA